MKTKLLFATFLLLFYKNIYSQPYAPFLNNTTWNVTVASFMGTTNYIINPAIDVAIGGFTYKKFADPIFGTDVYVREDVVAKKVYRRVDNADELLYDFSKEVSNTITLPNGNTYTLISISNVTVNGGTRRRFNFDNGFFGFNWIEGVGSGNHPLKPHYELLSDPYIYVTCSAQNGTLVYNHGTANGGTPTDCSMLGMDDVTALTNKITFYPNPFKTELIINSEMNLENVTLKLYNSLGQIVNEIQNINGQQFVLNRGNLNSGLYFIELLQNDKLVQIKKIVIED
ncbi:MAG: T9SS type A sorting domain-containing protein [Bacteroidota bacterium]